MTNKLLKTFTNNLSFALLAQMCSLTVSIIMSLIVPKILGVQQFAYWQLFIFYTTYTGLFHFGLSDGVYLRYGGYERRELNASLIGSQLKVMTMFHIGMATVIIFASLVFIEDFERSIVWVTTAVFLVIGNMFWYSGYVFQAINETKIYSVAMICMKASFAFFIGLSILFRFDNALIFIFLYTVSQLIGAIYILHKGGWFFKAKLLPIKSILPECIQNIKIGINLTLSNVASTLILGIGRIMVDASNGLVSFSMVSFAISMTNFFLMFISQVSMVMFPALRQLNDKALIKFFLNFRSLMSYIFCLIYIVYIPLNFLLSQWLPQYSQSLEYLSILMPVCLFDGKMQMLYNTFLKVLRKEKVLLFLNCMILGISTLLCYLSVCFFKSIYAVVVVMLLVIMLRSVVASVFLTGFLQVKFEKNLIWDSLISAIFVLVNIYFNQLLAFCVCTVIISVYWFVNRIEIINAFKQLKYN